MQPLLGRSCGSETLLLHSRRVTDYSFTATGGLLLAHEALSFQIVKKYQAPGDDYAVFPNMVQITSTPLMIFMPKKHQRHFGRNLSELLGRGVGLSRDGRVCVDEAVNVSGRQLHALIAASGVPFPAIVVYM